MNSDDPWDLEDPIKRARLMQWLIFGGMGLAPGVANAFFSKLADKLSDDRSIFTLKGDVRVNHRTATRETRIRAGDRVSTGEKSEVIFVVGGDSFIMRDNSEMEIAGSNFFIDNLRIVTGKLLSVFARRKSDQSLAISASTATIGIRGSGMYVEVEPELTYLCTCYGKVALSANDDPNETELIKTTNHDAPRYISNKPGDSGSRITAAPVINHTNVELQLLEQLVGRQVPKRLRKAYIKDY